MAVSINNKNGTTTKVATNVNIIKQPANHFMTKAIYDPNGEVAQAGGIPEYVEGEIDGIDSQISEISELVNIHEERRNIFDYTDVTDDKYRASTLGSSINDSVDKANGWYSNQIWEVKKGDVIYQSTRWFPLLIYNSDGILVEYRTNGDTGGIYTITNDNAKYLTIQASAHTNEYLYKLMLSINEPLPAEYAPYTDVRTVSQFDTVEDKIPTDGKAILDKGFVILSFDDFNSVDDTRFDIVNEYGFKASVACAYSYGYDWSDVYTKISKQGWDCHLYSGNNWPSAESYYVDNPSAEIQAVWDAYVKEEVDYALSQGVSNPTAWGCRQGKSCDGLENACRKYGIKMVRGGAKATKFTEKFSYATTAPTSLHASTTQNCINAFTAAANVGYGVLFTTHRIYETTEQADANYGMTEATLRQFLSALKALVDEGKLEVLTFREVYQKYYQNDALHNNYDRLAYRAFGTNLPSIDGLVRKKVYTPVDITPIANHYIQRTSGAISAEYSNVSYFEMPVTSGERYIVSTQHGYAMAVYALYNSDGDLVRTYPTSNVDITEESVEVTIPNGVTMMRGSGYNTVPLKVFKVTDGDYTIDTTANDILHGKKWVVCGDSFTTGTVSSYTDSEGHTGYESDGYDPIQGKLKNYSYFIANRTGINVTLLARGGSYFTNVEGANAPFSNENSAKNYTQIPSDADYITLAYGLNETTLTTAQIGTKEDTTNETLWGAYNVVLTSILTANPSVKIGIIINDAWMTKPYHDALIEIAENWGIPYLDMKDSVEVPIMIDGRFYDEVNDTAKALRNSAFKIADNAHPTPKAQEYRSTVIENFLRSL